MLDKLNRALDRTLAFECAIIITLINALAHILISPYWIITGHRVYWVYWLNGFMYFLFEEVFSKEG